MWNPASIRDLRRRLGKTQAQFAEDLGVTERTVKRYERDGEGPPADEDLFKKLDSLADTADQSLAPLVEREPAERILREKIAAALLDLPVADLLVLEAQAKRMQVRRLVERYADEAASVFTQQAEKANGQVRPGLVEGLADLAEKLKSGRRGEAQQ